MTQDGSLSSRYWRRLRRFFRSFETDDEHSSGTHLTLTTRLIFTCDSAGLDAGAGRQVNAALLSGWSRLHELNDATNGRREAEAMKSVQVRTYAMLRVGSSFNGYAVTAQPG